MIEQHVRVMPSQSGGVEVWVDDYELFDYLDDKLTEADLSYDFCRQEITKGRSQYIMVFTRSLRSSIERVLGNLPLDEIERIMSLNDGVG